MEVPQLQNILSLKNEKDVYKALLTQNTKLYEELNRQLIKNRNIGNQINFFPNSRGDISRTENDPSESANDKKESVSEKPTTSAWTQEIRLKLKTPKKETEVNDSLRKTKNTTKNISKNFGSAICTYIKKNDGRVRRLIHSKGISLPIFYRFSKKMKSKIRSIHDLRQVWSFCEADEERQYKTCFRIFSFQFLRTRALKHVFQSRIKNVSSHIKCRAKLLEGLQRPSELINLKDF